MTSKKQRLPVEPVRLAEMVAYQEGAIVSRTLLDRKAGTVTLFAFDEGQQLSEHTTPYDALVYVLEGTAEITIEGTPHRVKFDRARVALVRWACGPVIGMVALVPDLHLAYTPAHLKQDFAYWSQHRAAFLWGHLLVDNVYPLIYGLLLALLLTALRPRRFPDQAPWWALALPVAMVLADGSENVLLSLLMFTYPRFPVVWAWLASLATGTKWTLLVAQLGYLAWGGVQRLRKTP